MSQRAFTTRYSTRVNVLKNKVGITESSTAPLQNRKVFEYIAIWDTGATNTVITKKISQQLELTPSGKANMHHAGEGVNKSIVNTYLVDVFLPDGLVVQGVRVLESDIIDGSLAEDQQAQLLIGMDIIGMGDFAVTNRNNKTMLSYRYPSWEEIDFVPQAQMNNTLESGNREQKRLAKKKKNNAKRRL